MTSLETMPRIKNNEGAEAIRVSVLAGVAAIWEGGDS